MLTCPGPAFQSAAMPIDFNIPADSGFEAFGIAATYTPPGGSPVAVTVILDQPDEVIDYEMGRSRVQAIKLDVRDSEIAGGPAIGGQFVTESKTYRVAGEPRADGERLVWSCPATEVIP